MPSAFREPKTLPDWIELDYFRRPRGLRRWRRWAIGITFVACLAGVAATVFTPRSRTLYQAGPVSAAHALFNDDCAKCHTETFQTARRFWPGDHAVSAVPDEACIQCHDGPVHNTKLKEAQHCASCHREHRGRIALARLPDSQCTVCHLDLKANTRQQDNCPFADVTAFPAGHPDFVLRLGDGRTPNAADPGRLHFNHRAHLKPEGVLGPSGRTEHLECVLCHKPDVAGRYIKPIQYPEHCSRCHPLSVRLAGPFPGIGFQEEAFAAWPAPHKEPALVRAELRERLLNMFPTKSAAPVGDEMRLLREMPRPPERGEAELPSFVNRQLDHLEQLLFDRAGGCAYCHIPESPGGRSAGGLPKYAATNLPSRWFPHSRFSHERHRMVACTECHAAANSSRTSDVLMPTKDSCARCHQPRVGARSDCVECHLYHPRGDYPMHKSHTIDDLVGRKDE